jgi:hypothetical protein
MEELLIKAESISNKLPSDLYSKRKTLLAVIFVAVVAVLFAVFAIPNKL